MEISRVYQTVDAHTAGEPLRLIVSGVPPIPGSTMLEKRAYFREHLDHIRRALMLEPRGHDDMYGCVMTPPVAEGSDFGVLFMHNEGYSTMCGHGVIAVVTIAVQNQLVSDPSRIRIDSPAGLVTARADGIRSVTFENVPSFVYATGLKIEDTNVDIVFGGAFYALVQSSSPIESQRLAQFRDTGMRIKHEIERTHDVVHPLDSGLRGIYGTIFTHGNRNVTIFAEGEVDRSPCGTGTCGVLASRFARGILKTGERFVHESIIGTSFTGKVIGETRVAGFDAVIPEVTGSAYITGYHTFVIDPNDPVAGGFRV